MITLCFLFFFKFSFDYSFRFFREKNQTNKQRIQENRQVEKVDTGHTLVWNYFLFTRTMSYISKDISLANFGPYGWIRKQIQNEKRSANDYPNCLQHLSCPWKHCCLSLYLFNVVMLPSHWGSSFFKHISNYQPLSLYCRCISFIIEHELLFFFLAGAKKYRIKHL